MVNKDFALAKNIIFFRVPLNSRIYTYKFLFILEVFKLKSYYNPPSNEVLYKKMKVELKLDTERPCLSKRKLKLNVLNIRVEM